MSEVFTAIVLLILLLATVWCWIQWKFQRLISTSSKLPPLDTSMPFLGNIHLLFRGHDWISNYVIKILQQVGGKKEKNVAFWWGPYPYIVIGVGEDVETVLTSRKVEKSFHYDYFKIFFGNGLLTAPDDIHKTTRRHIVPMFMRRSILEGYSPSFNASSRKLAHAMSKHVGRGSMDVHHTMSFTTTKTICDLLLGPGVCPDEESELFKKVVPKIKTTAICLARRMATPWLWPNILFNFFYGKEVGYSQELWHMFWEVVQEKKEKMKMEHSLQNNKTSACNEENDSYTHLTLPEIYEAMQKDYPQFTKKDLEYELFTLFLVGSHTMAVFVSSMLIALAAYPDIQERLYQEVVSVVGANDNDVTTEDLKRMPYLDQIIKETLRRFFVVPIILRRAKEDLEIRDMTLPAGTIMIISLVTQLYDSDAYPDPQTFNPDRFSSENIAKGNQHSFSPFASGTRKCIGNYYARYLAKLIAVHVVRRFRLTTSVDINNMRMTWDFAAVSVDGYPIEIHPRETLT